MKKLFTILSSLAIIFNATAQNTFPATGNVGIGLPNPAHSLSIYANEDQTTLGNNVKSVIRLSNNYVNAFGRRSEIQFGLSPLPNELLAVIAGEYSTWNNGFVGGDLIFGTKQNSVATMFERMRIKWNGNVTIGAITNTSYKLAVGGKIAATGEVRVFTDGTTTFPDYVFDPAYQLPSLAETEKYVKENRHLPEVPSAADIEKDGMSLNGMNTILLKKVEEITLHLIEMKKESEIMKKEIKELKENQKR